MSPTHAAGELFQIGRPGGASLPCPELSGIRNAIGILVPLGIVFISVVGERVQGVGLNVPLLGVVSPSPSGSLLADWLKPKNGSCP